MHIVKFNSLKNFNEFLCIYLGEGGGGGVTSACICMGTQSQPLVQNHLMDIYQTW